MSLGIVAIAATLKEAAKVLQEAGKIDLYRQVLDGLVQVAELSAENVELEKKVIDLQSTNRDLQEQLKFSSTLEFRAPFYFCEGDPTPYCPKCWEVQRQAVHLIDHGQMMAGHRFDCPSCRNMVIDVKSATPQVFASQRKDDDDEWKEARD